MNDRDTILARIERSLNGGASEKEAGILRSYRRTSDEPLPARVTEFVHRVRDYHATVHVVTAGELAGAITSACRDRSVRTLVVPEGISPDWMPDGVRIERDSPLQQLSNEQLDASDGVMTGCALGIAQTGTIVLDGGADQGRRVITLLPDYHLCVIRNSQIVGLVPEAMDVLLAAQGQSRRPLTFISGPSATSDIELNRIEGVHGPRTLDVIVVTGA